MRRARAVDREVNTVLDHWRKNGCGHLRRDTNFRTDKRARRQSQTRPVADVRGTGYEAARRVDNEGRLIITASPGSGDSMQAPRDRRSNLVGPRNDRYGR